MKLTKTQIYVISLAVTIVLGYILWTIMFNKKGSSAQKTAKPEEKKEDKSSTVQTASTVATTAPTSSQAGQRRGYAMVAKIKCPPGTDVLYDSNTGKAKGCINLATGKDVQPLA